MDSNIKCGQVFIHELVSGMGFEGGIGFSEIYSCLFLFIFFHLFLLVGG